MHTSALAVLAYLAWMLGLLLIMEASRTWLVLSGRRAANTFQPDGADVSPFAQRLARAHANCYEHFPILAGLPLLALATGNTSITDPLALWLVAARVAQSVTHLISASPRAVQIRFSLFFAQLAIAAWWVMQLGWRLAAT